MCFLKKNKFVVDVCLVIFILLVVNGCTNISAPQPQEGIILEDTKTEEKLIPSETPASSPIKLNLSLSKAPALGQTTEIIAILTYIGKIKENMPEAVANINLPDGFELISGNIVWKGKLEASINFSIVIKAIKIGNWTIEGSVRSPPEGEAYFGGRDFIYITVLKDNAIISDTPFPKPAESCVDSYIDGELIQCVTEGKEEFVETELP